MAWKMRLDAVVVPSAKADPETGEPVSVAPGVLNVTVSYFDEHAPGEKQPHTFTFNADTPKEKALDMMLKQGRVYRMAKQREGELEGVIGKHFDVPE